MGRSVLRAMAGIAGRMRHWRGAHSDEAAPATGVVSERGPQEVEQWIVDRMLAGALPAAVYRSAMEQLAAATDDDPIVVDAVVWPAGRTSHADKELRRRLDRLALWLPDVPAPTARAAFALWCSGADADELVRLLPLTRFQASTIVVAGTR
jgi:hypothetical protein